MTAAEQKAAAKEFADYWKGKGYEKGQTQPFWLSLLRDVLGVEHPERVIEFEDKAHIDAARGFIDAYVPSTHVLIEQKSLGKNLRAGIPQSDGSVLSPFQQAKRYAIDLPYSRRPRWIVVCNFESMDIYDLERPNAEPERLLLADLPNEVYRLSFLLDTEADFIRREEEVSKAAGDVVGRIYNALLKQYKDPSNPDSLKSLNELCVRLVFLFYAEDAGVFRHLQFRDYLKPIPASKARTALIELFRVLDTKPEDRDPYLSPELAEFPYVNGGLFGNESLEIPQLTDEILDLIIKNGSEEFDWKDISPTIFGAVFESTLNPETRRSGGMHYTSLANIHKVIDPLFLDSFKAELSDIKLDPSPKSRDRRLDAFTDKLASLQFCDPACGSGNFLTETFVCLRRLENEALAVRLGKEMLLDLGYSIKVSIRQFHGIEINDFAVAVGKSALWIAESQMLHETETLLHRNLDFLPLKTYDGIVEGNALRIDWATLAPHFDFIMGNPPFIGYQYQTEEQKEDMALLFGNGPLLKSIDYVCGWYRKASDLIQGTDTRCAFVSTNSISQGEQVAPLWKQLHVKIDFAHRTFQWDSESNAKAHVHVVIVGFSATGHEPKFIFDNGTVRQAKNINPYLVDAPDILVESRSTPLCAVPPMRLGNMAKDGGNLIVEDADLADLLAKDPNARAFIRPLLGAVEFINRKKRWVLWLPHATPAQLRQCPEVMKRIEACRQMRLASKAASTRKLAETPTLFAQCTQVEGKDYILVPRVSSERRRYTPIGFIDKDTIVSDSANQIPEATLFHFGVLTSNVHMAWMRAVCGRLKSDYRYGKETVYNGFPWPNPTDEQKMLIEKTAQGILDARAKFPDSTLADLYDELTMPPDLRHAHQENDRAVMSAYGFPVKMTESECVAELFKMYQKLVDEREKK